MTTLGPEGGQNLIRPDLWVYIAMSRIRQMRDTKSVIDCVVSDDCQFHNEASVIGDLYGGAVIRVVLGGVAGSHQLEPGQSRIEPDYLLPNYGTPQELHESGYRLMHRLNIDPLRS